MAAMIVYMGLFAIISGCQLMARPAVIVSEPAPVEFKKYNEAVEAYQLTEYLIAIQQFTAIREQTANPDMARMALYGLACSKLMAADSPQEYKEALALWETWVQCASNTHGAENPLLLAPIIRDKMLFSHIPLAPDGVQAATEEETIPRWFMIQADRELQKMKKQLATADQNLDNKDKKIKALEKEIARLNQQIKDFESIDQKIQTKKSAIPSAD